MVSKRNDPPPTHLEEADRPQAAADTAAAANAAASAAAAAEAEDDRPLSHRRARGSGGFGPAIAGIMQGIDADIFRDPAAIQRMQRDSNAVVRTADGTVIAIELPGEGVIDDPAGDEKAPG
jgi:hypothetical protein